MIEGKVISVIRRVRPSLADTPINPEDELKEDLRFGDYDRVMVAHELENEFTVSITDAEIYGWVTVEDIACTIEQRRVIQ